MKLTAEEIAGLASSSTKFASLLKEAVNPASFNENVPGAQGGNAGPNDGSTGYGPNNAPAGVVPPTGEQPGTPEQEYAAVPEEGAMPPEQAGPDTPEAVGARAAQAFLGPVMEAAISGDPGAQDLVARAAGSVAGSVAESYSRSMQAGQGAAGVPAMPAVPTPEEDLATEIAGQPQQAAPPPQQPENGENGEEEELDENGQPKKKKKNPFPPKK